MPTVFITASNRWSALFWKEHLQRHGHVVTSTWHESPMVRTSGIPEDVKTTMSGDARLQIENSDFLLIISDPDMVPGGKFVDVGIALGSGTRVILVGRRENLKMYDPGVTQCESPDDVLKVLIDVEYPVSGG